MVRRALTQSVGLRRLRTLADYAQRMLDWGVHDRTRTSKS